MNCSPGRIVWAGIAFLGVLPTVFGNETYKFDQVHSTIGFRVHQFLGSTNGKFTRFSGLIELDQDHPERSTVSAKIEVGSIDTGTKKRDDHLRSEEFFDAHKYPDIAFKSRSVKQTGPQAGDITGDLSIHGVRKPVTLRVKLLSPRSDTKRTRWEVTADPINRRDFNLMFSRALEAVSGISQNVAIKIEIQAQRAE